MAVTARATIVQEVAAELLASTPALARGMAVHLAESVPELAGTEDGELAPELLASTEANIGQVLHVLKAGTEVRRANLPPEALAFMRGNVWRGVPLPALLRSYRLGHAWLWSQWSHALQERIDDPEELLAAQDATSAFMFAFVDRLCDVLVQEYGSEAEQLTRGTAQLRAEAVRAILAGEPGGDEEALSTRLGYELRREHLALRVVGTAGETRDVEREVREAAAALGARAPLVVASSTVSFDVWCGSYEGFDTAALERYAPPEGVRVAFGRPGRGLEGFRRSHEEAVHAARVVALARGATGPVTGYAQVEIVSLLAADLPRARAFVAGRLGPLAATGEPARRLRETLRAFLAAGGSATRVARELHVHQNTVAYRVKRAEELLGRRVTEDPVELICALELAATLGETVLVVRPSA
jgi:DNA-binding PucR family transcriptional regulator